MNLTKELVEKLNSEYSEYFNRGEIEDVLDVEGGLEGDITVSSGAHLELSRLRLVGNKSNNPESEFKYERRFYPGINTLISDNLKGKSTMRIPLKMIALCD